MKNMTLAEVGAWHRLLCQMGEDGKFVGEKGHLLTLTDLAALWRVSRATARDYIARWLVLGYVVESDDGYAVSSNYLSLLLEFEKGGDE